MITNVNVRPPKAIESTGFRLHHRQSRSAWPTGRAAIGSPGASDPGRRPALRPTGTAGRLLLQALEHDRLQVAVEPRPDRRRPRRLRLADLPQERQHVVAVNGVWPVSRS